MTARHVALLSLLLCLPASAANVGSKAGTVQPIVSLPASAVPGLSPRSADAAAPSLGAAPAARDAAAAIAAPAAAASAAASAAEAAPAAAAPQTAAGKPLVTSLGEQSGQISAAVRADESGVEGAEAFERFFDRGHKPRGLEKGAWAREREAGRQRGRGADAGKKGSQFIVNDEGVEINERAANYYTRVRDLVRKYDGQLDLSESLDVMDDTYAQVWAKLAVIESVAKRRNVGDNNTHLEETLMWVDGVLDDRGRKVAVHTHQVYFHHAAEPRSEIAEGIRRVDKYIDKEALENFTPGGKAESHLGPLDEVVLAFDTRGYREIKDHLRKREAEIRAAHGKRYRFVFVDEVTKVPQGTQAMRNALNAQIKKYKAMYENAGRGLHGLQKIIEGVIYSRYVGVLLELATIDYYLPKGYKIEHSGRELFDANGHYVTELDVVMRNPQGKLVVVEAKSARVSIPLEQALQDKVLYKLDTYKKHQALMEKALGGPFDVIFSFDVGDNMELAMMLKGEEQALSKKYGFDVSFVFISTKEKQNGSRR